MQVSLSNIGRSQLFGTYTSLSRSLAAAKLKRGRESSVEIVSDTESKPSVKKMKGVYISPVVLSLLHCSSRHHSEAGGLGVRFPSTECFSRSLAA